jgi:hypothetical protein
VGLKDRLKRLVRQREMDSFLLSDGSRFYYDPIETGIELFMHSQGCLGAHEHPEAWPEPPEIVKAMVHAADRREAYERLFADEVPVYDVEEPVERGGSFTPFPYDVEAFVERGKLVPRSLVVGYEPGEPILDPSGRAEGS